MSNETLLKKFDALDPHAQDQLIAFWDFLLANPQSQPNAVMSPSYRERISKLSVWADEDFLPLEEANQNWNWEPSQW